MPDTVRVRFAPSPTGLLHVGGARTALFNWLFARRHGGAFVLRIEDTDHSRERPGFREEIFNALRWLGITEDEGPNAGGPHGPYAQSERGSIYAAALATLQHAGRLYPCFCASQSVECRCGELAPAERERLTRELGARPALRMRVDSGIAHEFDDLIRGSVLFPPGEVEDFIVAKAGGDPLYNFVAAVDDAAMRITHVIRGEEHLANTPKQMLLQRALGYEPPRFAHVPIILNEERKKLSKRDGATAVSEYRALGYLPEALRNFLVLLGWSPGQDREVITLEEMIEAFSLERVQRHGAVFDTVKLRWMNGEYLRRVAIDEVVDALRALASERPGHENMRYDRDHLRAVAAIVRERVKRLGDILDLEYFFSKAAEIPWDPEAVAKGAGSARARAHLAALRDVLAAVVTFTRAEIEAALRAFAAERGVKAGEYIAPLRVALTGVSVSPGIFELCEVLGHEVVIGRIDAFMRAYPSEDG